MKNLKKSHLKSRLVIAGNTSFVHAQTRNAAVSKNKFSENIFFKHQFKKRIESYASSVFGKSGYRYVTFVNFELNKLEQQNTIQIPFILTQYNKDIASSHILDVGCGTGGATVAWAIRGAHSVGIDASKHDLELARLRAKSAGVNPKFVFGTGVTLPFNNNTFDIVLCDQVLEHIDDYDKTIKEMCRVLKKGGISYIDLPNRIFPFDPHYGWFFIHWLPKNVHARIIKLLGIKFVNYDVYFRTYSEIYSSIKRNNLEILATSKNYIDTLSTNSFRNRLAKFLVAVGIPFYMFSPTLQFIVRKK
jgi:ubiquinone/menaquinone biosynthesis C-methylase UbiE